MQQQINWQCKHFNSLTPHELYAIIMLRNEVFVVEQNCVFQDADGKDKKCYHLQGWLDKKLVAYARMVPQQVSYEEASIGRIVTAPEIRKAGIGKALMEKSIEQCCLLFNALLIKIGAQVYLKSFYESFGFIQSSEEYDEDGIPHIEMRLTI